MSSVSERRQNLEPFDKARIFSSHALFSELGSGTRDRLCAHAKMRSVKRGSTIFSKGDVGTSLFAVCSGTVQVIAPSTEGKIAVFNLVREGEFFGEIALLDGGSRTADAVAFTNCRLLAIDRQYFLSLLRNEPEFAIKLLRTLCARLRHTTEQVQDLMFLDLSRRLVKALLRLSQSTSPNRMIEISQTDLSHIVGMSREMINKQLQIWVRAGWIKLERRSITVLRPNELAHILAAE
jgi:CRP-like cAMP-binding protein